MEVRAKKALGQHFLTDQRIAQDIVAALHGPCEALEVGPGMGVLTQYLLQREDIDLKLVEIDGESVDYLLTHFAGMQGRLLQADFLRLKLEKIFPERFSVIGNFPYNISSQIFFKVLDYRESIPEVVCMIQKEVAERIAEGPGSKTYGILSVLLQAWAAQGGIGRHPPHAERPDGPGLRREPLPGRRENRFRPAPEDDAEPPQAPHRGQGRARGLDRRGKGGLHRQPGVRTPPRNLIRGRLHRPDQPVKLAL